MVPRIRFADEPAHPQPRNFWLVRLLITGLIAGAGGAAHVLWGFRLF
jgi:hypothetical protein